MVTTAAARPLIAMTIDAIRDMIAIATADVDAGEGRPRASDSESVHVELASAQAEEPVGSVPGTVARPGSPAAPPQLAGEVIGEAPEACHYCKDTGRTLFGPCVKCAQTLFVISIWVPLSTWSRHLLRHLAHQLRSLML